MSSRTTGVVSLAGIAAILGGVLVFGNLNGNLVYYLTPREAMAQRADFPDGRRFRLAGVVADGSVVTEGDQTRFAIGFDDQRIPVVNEGTPPQLFQENIPVVVEGSWSGDTFMSNTIIVKHDENYTPPDEASPDAAPRAGAVRQ